MKTQFIQIDGIEKISLQTQELNQSPLSATEVIIQSHLSYISPGTELSRVFGLKEGATYPVRPGYCTVGTILKSGRDDILAGDRVLATAPHSSAFRFDPAKSDGGVLYKLDPKTSDEEGAFLEMAWIACNGILPAEVKLGDRVLILGLGTLGLVVSRLYQSMGCEVLGADSQKERVQRALAMGIPAIDCTEADLIIKSHGTFDICVDAAGVSQAEATAILCASKYGQVLFLGSPRTSHTMDVTPIFNRIHMNMLTIIGAMNRRYPFAPTSGSRMNIQRTMAHLESLLHSKFIDVEKFISHRIKPEPDEVLKAYQGLMYDKDHYLGVIINWK